LKKTNADILFFHHKRFRRQHSLPPALFISWTNPDKAALAERHSTYRQISAFSAFSPFAKSAAPNSNIPHATQKAPVKIFHTYIFLRILKACQFASSGDKAMAMRDIFYDLFCIHFLFRYLRINDF